MFRKIIWVPLKQNLGSLIFGLRYSFVLTCSNILVSDYPFEKNNKAFLGAAYVDEGFNEALFHEHCHKGFQSMGWKRRREKWHDKTNWKWTALFKTNLLHCIFPLNFEWEKCLWNKRWFQQIVQLFRTWSSYGHQLFRGNTIIDTSKIFCTFDIKWSFDRYNRVNFFFIYRWSIESLIQSNFQD